MEMTSQPSRAEKSNLRAALPELGRWRRRLLTAGSALALSVYYLHYVTTLQNQGGGGFEAGDPGASSAQTLTARLVALALIVAGLVPIRLRIDSAFVLTALYCVALGSFLAAWAIYGTSNDTFFLNTILQLPVLLGLSGTRARLDYPRWFRFVAWLVAVQALLDIAVVVSGRTLWGYGAFVGGVGNPSSFGLLCALMCAFCLIHPQAGRHKRLLAVWLAIAAVMTKVIVRDTRHYRYYARLGITKMASNRCGCDSRCCCRDRRVLLCA